MTALAAIAQGYAPGPPRRRAPWGLIAGVMLAAFAHLMLFAILSLIWRVPPKPVPAAKALDVSLVDDVALDQRAPPSTEAPAQSRAPEQAAPEDAPPPPPAETVEPDPTLPKPQPKAAPPPKPAPQAAPASKQPVAEKPDKAEKTKPTPRAATTPSKTIAATKGAGTNANAKQAKATGSLLDADFRKGLTQTPSKSKADVPPAATMDGKAAADIGSAIRRQVQPCADRQVNPGPGASRIVVTIRLQLNQDGTLAARPTVSDDHGGVDDENRRYVEAVDRNAIATFTGCAPLKGLPPELYGVPRGWKTFNLRYKLPG